jgi:all-trans-8'-apo-beta-carotenal 15,15'-oxygenase
VLTCDFIGGDLGGGLGDEDSPLFRLMRGEPPGMPAEAINLPRRVRVDMARGAIEEQIIDDTANFELPCVSATERGRPYTKAYMIEAERGDVFAQSLCQLDGATLERRRYTFGPGEYCAEPVFCDTLNGSRGRYLLTQIYSATDKASSFALFDEAYFEEGPIARIPLEHHVPLSFHGYWSGAG